MSQLLLLLLLVLPPQLLVSELVDRVSEKYGRLTDFSAEFQQISEDFSNQPSHYRGLVYLKSGKRARFEYDSPRKKSEYFDGKIHTVYTPDSGQAFQQAIGRADEELLAILQVVGNRSDEWKKQFGEKKDLGLTPQGNRVVRLIPNNKDLREVLIEVHPSSFLIQRVVFTSVDGQRNEFKFANINVTTRQDESFFKFTPPPGVKVIKE